MTKTIELMVRFTAEVDENVNVDELCLDLDLNNVALLDENNKPLLGGKFVEYETMETGVVI